jgi:hypothetical protein
MVLRVLNAESLLRHELTRRENPTRGQRGFLSGSDRGVSAQGIENDSKLDHSLFVVQFLAIEDLLQSRNHGPPIGLIAFQLGLVAVLVNLGLGDQSRNLLFHLDLLALGSFAFELGIVPRPGNLIAADNQFIHILACLFERHFKVHDAISVGAGAHASVLAGPNEERHLVLKHCNGSLRIVDFREKVRVTDYPSLSDNVPLAVLPWKITDYRNLGQIVGRIVVGVGKIRGDVDRWIVEMCNLFPKPINLTSLPRSEMPGRNGILD